ncbi:MAG TPA: [FeFe] hydrogenase H-cluster radical SAM maturase HydE [bacterium]|nr:[FeFe] hydrogenase H-cluster radical SAM maturase HydE [bacterium]
MKEISNQMEFEQTLARVSSADRPSLEDLVALLSVTDKSDLEKIYAFADRVRQEQMGEGILLRGIVEFSNECDGTCHYCGLNRNNARLPRFTLSREEIIESVGRVVSHNLKTVVLQSGESSKLDPALFAEVVRDVKSRFDVSVTLSVGEKSRDAYALWREAGADRYLLKIETTDEKLYAALHPGMSFGNRLRCLRDLKELGYQTGSGDLIGLPGQTPLAIARDILFFKENDFDMIGIGPFIPHGQTALAGQARGSVDMVLKAVALTRIVTKNAHLPATTALGSMGKDHRIDGLKAGANVMMPNFTPSPYRKMYEIYPDKRCVEEPVGQCAFCIEGMAKSIGRCVDYGKGDSLKKNQKEGGR